MKKRKRTNGKIERGRSFENFSSRQSTFTTGEIEFNGDAYAAFRETDDRSEGLLKKFA